MTELRTLAAHLSVSVVEVLIEAQSAQEPGRPIFNSMMERLSRGEANGILCWRLDRLARNPVDGGDVIWAVKEHGIRIITPTQTFSRDDDNAILMYLEFGIAQKYVDDLSRNVKRGLQAKAERGWWPNNPPFGYRTVRRPDGRKIIARDPAARKA